MSGIKFPLNFIERKSMIETLKETIEKIIQRHPFELYEVHQTMIFGQQGIEVLVDNDDGPISTDALESFHKELLELDNDILPDHLILEVSSVGIERPLKSEKDYLKAVKKYIYLVSDHYKGNATLESYSPDQITISYLDKTKKIEKTIPIKSISSARRAVKF